MAQKLFKSQSAKLTPRERNSASLPYISESFMREAQTRQPMGLPWHGKRRSLSAGRGRPVGEAAQCYYLSRPTSSLKTIHFMGAFSFVRLQANCVRTVEENVADVGGLRIAHKVSMRVVCQFARLCPFTDRRWIASISGTFGFRWS
jgi:hypothetical protein